ncbi:MAG TPA: PAS domain-containing protein [Solirubrobacteraceae bacterium]
MEGEQKPLELILARNLMCAIETPAFLVDTDGILVFWNEGAATLLGKRFEETGKMPHEKWGAEFGPFGEDDKPIPFEQLPLTIRLRAGKPAHATFNVRSAGGEKHRIEASALPLVGDGGFRGALAIFWPLDDEVAA